MSRLLIIEDEAIIRSTLRRLLERQGHEVVEAASIPEALELGPADFDLIISDLRLPGPPGTEIIPASQGVPVLIMTSYASVKSAVESMKLGAVDYIAKPFDHDEMAMLVERILKQGHMERQNAALKSDLLRDYPVAGMIGNCEAMQQVFDRIHKVAPTDTTVMILGESGTGKELAARALHELSPRAPAPMITVNCAAIPEGLIESELFGHEKGAFTGASGSRRGLVEAADGGTLFLDEIGELPLDVQARLLRVLQEGEIRRVGANQPRRVDVRLITATHRDLQQMVAEGGFREDLYYRLRVMELNLPPLRERGEDIIELAEALLQKSCKRLNRPSLHFDRDALIAIRHYDWPGNVRELENILERAVILSDSTTISADLLAIHNNTEHTIPTGKAPPTEDDKLSLDDYFINFVRKHEGNFTETELARQLGISRKTLWERRNRLGIPRQRSES
ncbi:MAG: sigma-54-dependent Fis family transcriptional regulator [Gammaproteobacteria bacterium]|nr:sigma-54-dependent Fis family transcriptional regulator [Gammaproteobacteria bacterium]